MVDEQVVVSGAWTRSVSPQPIPQAHLVFQKEYYFSLVSSASDNPKRLWQTVSKLLHRKSSLPLPTTSPGTSLADSFASFVTGKCLSLTRNHATSSPHLPSFLLLPLISQSSPLPRDRKFTRSCPTVQTSNLTQIRSPPGFGKSAHPFSFPQSPILLTCPSSPVSLTPLSKNPLSHYCLRNRHWIKKNSQLIGQSPICLSFPK